MDRRAWVLIFAWSACAGPADVLRSGPAGGAAASKPSMISVDSPFCRSHFVIEGDIVGVRTERAPSVRARIRVSHAYKGRVPAEIDYAHAVDSEGLDQLVPGDHVVVFGEYDAERASLFNQDAGRRHLVRDDTRRPAIMYHRTYVPPAIEAQMDRALPRVVVRSIFPSYETVVFGREGADDVAPAWDDLAPQIDAAIRSRADCAAPGSYPGSR